METNNKQWMTISEIQATLLPISKKAIRKLVKENLDVVRYGRKMLIERKQLMDYLRNEY